MKILQKTLKKHKRYFIMLGIFFIISLLYLLSYPLLPLVEKMNCKFLYLAFAPLETIRSNSDTYWKFTEQAYLKMGGGKKPSERKYFSNCQRKNIQWYSNGRKKNETVMLFKDQTCLFQIKEWAKNGVMIYSQSFENDHKEILVRSWDENGNLICIGFYKVTIEGFRNKILGYADCLGIPYSGTFLLYEQNQQYIISYINGQKMGKIEIKKKPTPKATHVRKMNLK